MLPTLLKALGDEAAAAAAKPGNESCAHCWSEQHKELKRNCDES
jgi:hypothetical protein